MRATVRAVAARCLRCRIQRTKPQIPRMAVLPEARTSHHRRPFTFCGIDYFGPMTISVGRHHEKCWGVLFTCLTTRAVHLEVAASLSTDSTIMAIRRMAARRGYPTEIYSDNGTNLRGTNTELRKTLREFDQRQQHEFATNNNMTWKFIPPAAPHMRGSWEALVRSAQDNIKRKSPQRRDVSNVLDRSRTYSQQ